jgi:hypothetical protein
MKRAILILGVLLLFPFYSRADPSPEIRWLQNAPVTLFDWGMRRADESLEQASKVVQVTLDGTVMQMSNYDFTKNSIDLWVIVSFPKKTYTTQDCKDALTNLHRVLLVRALNETNEKKKAYVIVNNWFSHEGFQTKSRPKTLEKEVAELTTLKISINHNDDSRIICAIPLTGGSISVTNIKPEAKK